jgi:hypothetical protein
MADRRYVETDGAPWALIFSSVIAVLVVGMLIFGSPFSNVGTRIATSEPPPANTF